MLLNIDHAHYQAPSTNGHKAPIWDSHDVHDHFSARAERVRSNVFWGESKYDHSHSLGIIPDGGDGTGNNN